MKQCAPRLVGLKIDKKGIPDTVCQKISSLKSLHIDSYHGCIKKDLTLFRQSSNILEELILEYQYGFKYFIHLDFNFTVLTKLEIVVQVSRFSGNADADWWSIITIANKSPNLKKLEFTV